MSYLLCVLFYYLLIFLLVLSQEALHVGRFARASSTHQNDIEILSDFRRKVTFPSLNSNTVSVHHLILGGRRENALFNRLRFHNIICEVFIVPVWRSICWPNLLFFHVLLLLMEDDFVSLFLLRGSKILPFVVIALTHVTFRPRRQSLI